MNTRLNAFSILIVLNFMLIGTAGLFLFGSMNHGSEYFCPISALVESNCLFLNSVFEDAAYHISGWQKIFLAIIFVLAALLPLIFRKRLDFVSGAARGAQCYQRHSAVSEKVFKSLERFLHWLTILNKPDSYVLRRARV